MSESKPATKLRYSLTDLGNAIRLASEHHQHLKYVPGIGFRENTGTRWIESESAGVRAATDTVKSMYREASKMEEGETRKRLAGHATECEAAAAIRNMVTLAKSQPQLETPATFFDADHYLFNVQNGTVDLRTGQLRNHCADDLVTKISPVAFDDKADCPLWRSVLNRSFAGNTELIGYVQRLFGYCLTGDISEQVMPVAIGAGANGKSVQIDTIAHVMGDYCGPAPESLMLSSNQDAHPCDLADCEGKRLLWLSETEGNRKWRLQRMKSLTGDAIIKARRMRENFYAFQRTHKMFLISNTAPRVTEDSEAVWRRLKRIPYDVIIPPSERDPKLLDKLKLEAGGILNWLIEGCLQWQHRGCLDEPAAVTAATATYREESDVLREFIMDRCQLSPMAWTSNDMLYQAYRLDAEAAHEKAMSKRGFSQALGRRAGIIAKRTGAARGWSGIELNAE